MTVKELLSKLVSNEKGAFVRVLEALPADKLDYKPDPRSKSAGEIMAMLPMEPGMIVSILKTGGMSFDGPDPHASRPAPAQNPKEAAVLMSKALDDLKACIDSMLEEDFDKQASISGQGSSWTVSRAEMSYGFLMDMIHHRGQLSTYLRPMGGKVPSIYGPSADSGPVGN